MSRPSDITLSLSWSAARLMTVEGRGFSTLGDPVWPLWVNRVVSPVPAGSPVYPTNPTTLENFSACSVPPWVIGRPGRQSCNDVCLARGRPCLIRAP